MSFLYKQYESLHKLRLPTVTVVQNTQMWNPRPLSFFILGLYPTPRPQNHSSKGEQPSQVAQQWVKNLPAMQETQETWLRSLGGEEPQKEEMAAHSSIPAWKIVWTKEPGELQSKGSQRVGHTHKGEQSSSHLPCVHLCPFSSLTSYRFQNGLREWGWLFSKWKILGFCQSSSHQPTFPSSKKLEICSCYCWLPPDPRFPVLPLWDVGGGALSPLESGLLSREVQQQAASVSSFLGAPSRFMQIIYFPSRYQLCAPGPQGGAGRMKKMFRSVSILPTFAWTEGPTRVTLCSLEICFLFFKKKKKWFSLTIDQNNLILIWNFTNLILIQELGTTVGTKIS